MSTEWKVLLWLTVVVLVIGLVVQALIGHPICENNPIAACTGQR